MKKYAGAARRWRRWAKRHHLEAFPADAFHVAHYLVELMQSAKTPAPIVAAIYGISWALQLGGWPDVTQDNCVQRVLQGARRLLSRQTQRMRPLTKRQLKQIAEATDQQSLGELQTLLLIVLGYAGFFRWDDLSSIFADEIIFRRDYMAVFLARRKNDQFREGSWIVISRWSGDLCPVSLTEEFLQRGKHQGHVKLFRKISAGRKTTSLRGEMTYSRALELVREALRKVGLSERKYGLHSLRAGGASAAAALGLPDRLIMRQGGWRSESAMRRYFRETLPNLMQVSQNIAPH